EREPSTRGGLLQRQRTRASDSGGDRGATSGRDPAEQHLAFHRQRARHDDSAEGFRMGSESVGLVCGDFHLVIDSDGADRNVAGDHGALEALVDESRAGGGDGGILYFLLGGKIDVRATEKYAFDPRAAAVLGSADVWRKRGTDGASDADRAGG